MDVDGAQGGAAALATADDKEWALPIGAAVLAVRHMGLSGWQTADCAAVENELTAWQRAGELTEAENALRCGGCPSPLPLSLSHPRLPFAPLV